MNTTILIIIILLLSAVIILITLLRPKHNDHAEKEIRLLSERISELRTSLSNIEQTLKEDFRLNREENSKISQENRKELMETLTRTFREFQESFDRNVKAFNDLQREKFGQLEDKQVKLVESTEKKLEEMRVTVDEKLQKTLNERLGQSFELVGKQLESVQKGLGEMQTLAQDVGGLKKVLSNVKARGGIGEVQLGMLLEQILAPEQYAANVKTRPRSKEVVEYAIKLPGRDDTNMHVWLPVDAKFPKDKYENLLEAYDSGDLARIDSAQKELESTIKKMAKDIREKYLEPPFTTDFGLMFLPFEGIFAEVVRRAALLEELQNTYKVIVVGPTTLAAILNSLQMGFRTLAIQKRSSEVWRILGAVKKEFERFGGMLEKAQGSIQTGLNHLEKVVGVRSRAIQSKLKNVEMLGEEETSLILPEAEEPDYPDEENSTAGEQEE
ncbi:MAG TPA: DNA recombination protein RmuC [Bacteroidales bacterium]|nr:DNA recombination protein RmuC [Bacteroidales bacterium]